MIIHLYKNTAERNSMRPALTQIGTTLQGNLRDSTSLLNITLLIEYYGISIVDANYLYVEELGRFYHIDNVSSIRNNLTELNCTLDPLYTYYSDIINCNGIIGRCESRSANRYLEDNRFSYPVYPAIIRKVFSNYSADTTLVLIVNAGASDVSE